MLKDGEKTVVPVCADSQTEVTLAKVVHLQCYDYGHIKWKCKKGSHKKGLHKAALKGHMTPCGREGKLLRQVPYDLVDTGSSTHFIANY